MKEGLYRVAFQTRRGASAGVVVLNNGNIRGGDSMMYYDGTYVEEGQHFKAQVRIGTHTYSAHMQSVLRGTQGQIDLEGDIAGDKANLRGRSPQAPGVPFAATLSLLAS